MNNINSSIDKYRNIHKKSKIAILGSSPTLELYENKEDISIAVNGAPLCLSENYKINYFMCGDKDSHDRQWFLSSEKFNAIRIVSSFVLPYDPIIIPKKNERYELQKRLKEFYENEENYINFNLDDYVLDSKHGFFHYSRPWNQIISKRQKKISKSATISGVAAQMALIMGAKEIHLYGCSFGDVKNKHYYYDSKGEPGGIKLWQPVVMDFILYQMIKKYNIEIIAHGETTLRIPKRVD